MVRIRLANGDGAEKGLRRDRAAEEMGIARLAGAGLAGKDRDKRGCCVSAGHGGRFGGGAGAAVGEALQSGLHGGDIVEAVHAVSAAAEFSGGLRAAEEQEAEEGGFVPAEVEDGADAVLVLGDPGVADGGD